MAADSTSPALKGKDVGDPARPKVTKIAPMDDIETSTEYTKNQALAPGDRAHIEATFGDDEKRAALRDARADAWAESQRPGVVRLDRNVKRFFTELRSKADPRHRLRAAY